METVELRGPGADRAVARLHGMGGLDYVIPMETTPTRALVRLGVKACPLVDAMRDTSAVPHLPFTVKDREDRWLLAGDTEGAHQLQAALASRGLARRILRSGDWRAVLDDLTALQRNALEDAVRLGYYDYPRGISLTDLARRRSVAKSTISQTLRVVEKKIMAAHVSAAEDELFEMKSAGSSAAAKKATPESA